MIKKDIKHPAMDPVIIEADGSIVDTVNWYTDSIDIKTFIERLASSFDLDVIFQRDQVWPDEMKAELIRSIMNGTPIGYCLLCEKPNNVAHKNVIDFKNRSLAIRDFWDGKFSILIRIRKNGVFHDQRLTWKDILESDDAQLQNMKEKFETYKVSCIVYKGMNLVQQSKKYITQNTNMPFQNEDLLYGRYFWAKGFYNTIFNVAFENIIKHTRAKQEKNNIKQKGTIFAHRVIYTCYGPELDDVWAVRDLGNSKSVRSVGVKPFVKGTSKINESLAQLLEDNNSSKLDYDFIRSSPYWQMIDELKKCCDHLSTILEFSNPTKKKLKKNDLFDCIVFFNKKIREGRLTFAMMVDDTETYYNIIMDYISKKSTDPTMTGQSVTIKMIKERATMFDEVWLKHVSDDGYKNQLPTDTQISIAYLRSKDKCPITGEALSDSNAVVEHVDPKSKNSCTEYQIVSKRGNQWKSNRTKEENEMVLNYQKRFSDQ